MWMCGCVEVRYGGCSRWRCCVGDSPGEHEVGDMGDTHSGRGGGLVIMVVIEERISVDAPRQGDIDGWYRLYMHVVSGIFLG